MNTFNISYIVKTNRVHARNIAAISYDDALLQLREYCFNKGLEVTEPVNESEFNGQMKV